MGCLSLLLPCLSLLSVLCIKRTFSFDLVILHTNDVHARVEETSADSGKCASDCYAGVARRWTKIRQIKREERNVLLLDAGDQYQGTIWFNYYKGAEAAHFMHKLGYDAMALGNHEFDNGVDGLLYPFLQNVSFPVLSANVKADQQLSPSIAGYYMPYKILNVSGQEIGLVGYTSKETPMLSDPGPHLIFEDEIEAVQREVQKLTTLGVNKIIALGHSGFETDKKIAKNVRGIDVVVGGHSNTFLYTGHHVAFADIFKAETWTAGGSDTSDELAIQCVLGDPAVYAGDVGHLEDFCVGDTVLPPDAKDSPETARNLLS